jgi:hypothetical protein
MLKPCANASVAPFFMLGSTPSRYCAAMCSSGISIITMSAPFTAPGTSTTLSPAFFALSHDAPPGRSPTVTLTPESCRFNACACPCEPYPTIVTFLPLTSDRSASFS